MRILNHISLLLFIISSISLFQTGFTGQIWGRDIRLDLNNRNNQGTFYFYFTLETAISSTDYLRFVMPFQINSVSSGYWGVYANCIDSVQTQEAAVTASTISGDTNAFFVKFYANAAGSVGASLQSNTLYFLSFIATPDTSASLGISLPVQMLTVSNNQGNWVTYDYNPTIGIINLFDTYGTSMTVALSIDSSQTNSQVPSASYSVNFDFTPTISIANGARVYISMTNTNFFLSNCSSVSNSTVGYSSFSSIAFTNVAPYSILATTNQTVQTIQYRFVCTVQNPSGSATGGVTIANWHLYESTIVESVTVATGLSSVQTSVTTYYWSESNHVIYLGWGYEASSATALSIFSLYKDANANEKWYQSTQACFQPGSDVTSAEPLQIIMQTVNDATMTILLTSLLHNLPDYSSSQTVSCVPTTGYLTCSNIGFLNAQQYCISFKFNLANTLSATTAPNFGQVMLQTQVTSTVYAAYSSTTLTNTAIATNPALFYSSGANGRLAYTKFKVNSTVTNYIHAGDPVYLNIEFHYFTSTLIPLVTTNANLGIQFYTSPALPSASNPTCTIATLTSDTDISITDCSVTNNATYTLLTFRIAKLLIVNSGSPCANLFTSSPNDGTVVFDYVTFDNTKMSSLNYVNEYVYDFYSNWVQGFTDPNPTITTLGSPFFFNSLVYAYNGLYSLDVSMSFFVTGATSGDAANDGSTFPSMIRVSGILQASEQLQANNIIMIFFNDLVPADTNNICFGPSGTTCTYLDGGLSNTNTANLVDYSGSRRIIISTVTSASLNIYIPVQTSPAKTIIGFFLAAATIIDSVATSQNIYLTTFSRVFMPVTYTKTSSGSTLQIAAAGGSTPTVDLSSNPVLGSTGSTNLINMGASYVITTPNFYGTFPSTPAMIGAGYGLCANYDFTVDPNFAFTAFPDSPQTDITVCRTIKYKSATSKNVYCQVCPVHTAMTTSANVPITSFKYSQDYGIDFGNLVYISSLNNGNLQSSVVVQKAGGLTATALSTKAIVFSPSSFKKGSQNHLLQLQFTTVTTLPPQIQITLTPNSPTDLYFNPVTGTGAPACTCLTLPITSCAVTGTSTTNIVFKVQTSSTSWPAQEQIISFYADSTNPSLSADSTNTFDVSIQVLGIATTPTYVSHHLTGSTSASYTVYDLSQNYLVLSDFSYSFANRAAKTLVQFTFELPSDIQVATGQRLIINLGDIAGVNSGFTPLCYFIDVSTGLVSNNFLSCDVSNLAAITVTVNGQTTGTYTAVFPFLTAPNTNAAGISMTVVAFDGSTTIAQTNGGVTLALTATTAGTAISPTFSRLYSDPGTVGLYSFTVTSSINLTPTCSIYVYFPNYYSPKLGYVNLACTASGVTVACALRDNHLLRVTAFPTTITSGTAVTVSIYGVIVPYITAGNLQSFFVATDNDGDISSVKEQGSVTDTVPNSASPTAQSVTGWSFSTDIIRTASTVSLTFPTDSTGVRKTNYLTLDFPDSFGNLSQTGSSFTANLIKSTTPTTPIILAATVFGSRLRYTLPSDLEPLATYTITVSGVQTPDLPDCNAARISLGIIKSDESTALYRSTPQTWDTTNIQFIEDPSLLTLYFQDLTGANLNYLEVTTGVVSPPIRIVPSQGVRIQNDIVFTLSDKRFVTFPSPINAYAGYLYSQFTVAATATASIDLYSVSVSKTEVSSYDKYTSMPNLKILLTDQPQVILTPNIQIAIGGTSVPYYFDLGATNMIPFSNLQIIATVPAASSSLLTIVGASKINFNLSNTTGYLTLSLANTATLSSAPTFNLALQGSNAASYELESSTISVTVISAPTSAPSITLFTIPAGYGATKQNVTLQTNQLASVYWHIAYSGQFIASTCTGIQQGYTANYQYSKVDPVQAQFGAIYIQDNTNPSTFIINNLYANTKYSIVACAVNQLAQSSAVTSSTFTMLNTQAGAYKLTFNFFIPISKPQIAALACLFQEQLQLPNLNVIAQDGTTCYFSTRIDNLKSTTYSTLILYVFGNRQLEQISTLANDLLSLTTVISMQVMTNKFYQTFVSRTTSVQAFSLFNTVTLDTVIAYPYPVLASTSFTKMSRQSWIVVQNLLLSSGAGVFYGVANILPAGGVPTAAEVLNGKTLTGRTSAAAVSYSDGTTGTSLNFTNLAANTTYTIYVVAKNGDLSPYFYVSGVTSLTANTEALFAKVISSGITLSSLMILLLVFFLY